MAQLHLQLQADAGAAGHSHVIIEMPQLDATSQSDAADDHNHAMEEMARIDNNGRRRSSCSAADDENHVVIDIDGGTISSSDETPSCVVCTEPLEWVAVGRCGHRAVCSACAARIRCPPKPDLQCCICRTLCPYVVVTKVATTAAADGEPSFSDELPAASQDGRVGDYWYRAAMSAYFDNEQQYEAAAKAASLKEHPSASSVADGEHGQHSRMPPFLIYCLYTALLGVAIGLMFAMDATGWGQTLVILSRSAAVSVAIVLWFLAYYGKSRQGEQQQET
uniref:RING-type domain-containing protein n=1 Tax=Oryza brachyantha TaxID=4533 RepID=J3LC59_ORYBR